MARKRMLAPEFWDDDDLIKLTRDERLLFAGLMSMSDDYAHVDARPFYLKKQIFGYDNDLTVAAVEDMLNHILEVCRNAHIYEVNSQRYIWLAKWEEHQDLRYRAQGQYPCHACGMRHKKDDYEAAGCASTPVSVAYILRSSAQELTQDLPPGNVTLCNVKKRNTCDSPQKTRTEPIADSGQESTLETRPTDASRESKKTEAKPKSPREDQVLYAVLAKQLGYSPQSDGERSKWNKAIKDLRAADPPVTPEELPQLCAAYKRRLPEAALTVTALSNNVGLLRKLEEPNGRDSANIRVRQTEPPPYISGEEFARVHPEYAAKRPARR